RTSHEGYGISANNCARVCGEYEDVHGPDRALWPVQHPGVVLDAVLSSAHGACLGCQWFDVRGHWMGQLRLVRTSLCVSAPTLSLDPLTIGCLSGCRDEESAL